MHFLALLLILLFPHKSFAQEVVDSPAPSEAIDTLEKGYKNSEEVNFANIVVLQGLNKITAQTSTLEIPLNTPVRFGNLEIRLESCWKSAPEERPESAALLQVSEQKPGEHKKQIFFGWMFASSPSISSIEHSVYDLTVIECRRSGQ